MKGLVVAYHSLIDREYEKYKRSNERIEESYLTQSEAINTIASSLRCDQNEARNVLNSLIKMGFMVLNGQDKLRTLHFDVAYRTSNMTIEYGSLRYPLETKIYVRDEKIPSFMDHSFEEISKYIPSEIYPIIKHALYKDPKGIEGLGDIEGFSDFQFKAIKSILQGGKRAYVLIAPTSGGKTYAFLIPALIQVLLDKLKREKEGNIKALLIYPRKSLERDQFNKILAVLYRVNQYLQNFGFNDLRLTVAIDDGETPWKKEVESDSSFRGAICPACGNKGKKGGELKYLKTTQGIWVRCSHCGATFDWIYGYREEIWEKKPDILFTNIWTLDWRLPSKTIQHDYKLFKDLKIIILDEAHVYQSLLGGNVRYLIKRLEISSKSQPIIVISSATISKPKDFARDLLDLDPEREFAIIESREKGESKKVIYLILAVNPLRSWETVVYELALLLGTIHYYRRMQGIIFIDSVRELYRIFHQAKVAATYYHEPEDHFNQKLVPDAADPYAYWPYILKSDSFDPEKTPYEIFQRIMIHHAGIKDRERIEKEFVDGKLGVLISTSTLELGVDYPNVTFIGIVGVPFMLESIPQRIGRAGRNLEKTLYTTLSIIVLRNTPMELYYLYNPEDLIEGFRNKDIPIAWKNTAVKRYQVFSLLLDEMARKGKSTYILGSDGKLSDLNAFLDEVSKILTEAKALLDNLNARIKKEEDVDAYLLVEELMEEFNKLPERIEEWERLGEHALKVGEIIKMIETIARRTLKLGKRIGDKEVIDLARELFKLLRKVYT
ncbi:MAG: DEAD/DEAH box helicase [Saccharolobus sp.]|uniref:DEAD/DEAH box helicase n=1 Tax=Saccharolobus sp. TaxID=2100761 RepID=UPI0031720A07